MAAKKDRKRAPRSRKTVSVSSAKAASLATLSDDDLLETVQRQTFNFFWDGAHPQSGLAFDGCTARRDRTNHKTAVGGSGLRALGRLLTGESVPTRHHPASARPIAQCCCDYVST